MKHGAVQSIEIHQQVDEKVVVQLMIPLVRIAINPMVVLGFNSLRHATFRLDEMMTEGNEIRCHIKHTHTPAHAIMC